MAKRTISEQVIAITGGGRGIGAATAAALAGAGAHVAIGDVDLVAAKQVAADIGGTAVAMPLDVTDPRSFRHFLDDVEGVHGPVDVLVNNAGIMPIELLHEEAEPVSRRIIDVNVHGVINGSREALIRMLPRGRGHIVNVSSTLGKLGLAGGATYCASKYAVVGLSEALRQEVRGTGVDVSLVMPAVVRTELSAGLADVRAVKSVGPDDVAAAIVRTIGKPRFDVFVPRSMGWIAAVSQPLPRRTREGLARSLGADRLLLDSLNSAEREDYERRAMLG